MLHLAVSQILVQETLKGCFRGTEIGTSGQREQHRTEKGNSVSISEKRRDKVAGGGTGRSGVGVVRTLQMRRNPSSTMEDQENMAKFWRTDKKKIIKCKKWSW